MDTDETQIKASADCTDFRRLNSLKNLRQSVQSADKKISYLCFICHQVIKARINKGFLGAMDGHCQWNCQPCGE
jgi:hypothetical protein